MDFDLSKSCAVINLTEQLTCVTLGRRWCEREGAFQKRSLIQQLSNWSFQIKCVQSGLQLCPPLLPVMCFASALLAGAGSRCVLHRETWLGCFDVLNFTQLRCFLSAEQFGDSSKRGFRDRSLLCREGGRRKLTLSNKNVLTAFCFAETWEGFCLFSNVQQKDI